MICDLSTPCRAVSKAAACSQILVLVGDVSPHENMFLDTLLVQNYWYTKQMLAFNPLILNPYSHPFGTEEAICVITTDQTFSWNMRGMLILNSFKKTQETAF